MANIINVIDLPASLQDGEMIETMVAGANAKASRVAPCLFDSVTPPSADQLAEAKLILVGAVKRWAEAGAGSAQAMTAGPFGMTVDTRQRGGFNLWPSEITDLQAICSAGSAGRTAFSVDTAPVVSAHMPWCNLNFGGVACSCGADIAGTPIYELDY